MEITRDDALRFRAHQHGFTGAGSDAALGTAVAALDLGVQDTGFPGAARWALRLRGAAVADDALAYVWTLRGAPHAYRRAELAEVAAATAPYDEADAAKRVYDAAKPLKAAGITVSDALDTVAEHLADIVTEPTVKGEVSTVLTERLPEPYLRWCRPCQATHLYEQTFRLSALRAGLELTPGTSPPVLRPIAGWAGAARDVPSHLDAVRASLHLTGPTTPKLVAEAFDAPVRTVRAHWPEGTARVTVDGEPREVLADDLEVLRDPPAVEGVRLLGPFDPWLQVRDRTLLVADAAARKALWPVLGRPGALLVDHEVVGTWRPRSRGDALSLLVAVWDGGDPPAGIEAQAEALAAHRGQRFAGFVDA